MSFCLCHCRNGHLTVVQYLVEKCSVDVNLEDNEGCTPLHDACLWVIERMYTQLSRKDVSRSMSELVYVLYGLSWAEVPSLLLLNIQNQSCMHLQSTLLTFPSFPLSLSLPLSLALSLSHSLFLSLSLSSPLFAIELKFVIWKSCDHDQKCIVHVHTLYYNYS